VSDWRKGSTESTEMSLAEMKTEWPQIYRSMITDRHDVWLPQIEKFLNSDTVYFIIVGLAHIHGPDGLLRLLKDLGCTVEQY